MIASTNALAKTAAVVAGLGLVAMSFAYAAPARAATAEELQAQVDALLAQIAGLGGSTSAGTTFTMDLTIGSTGTEVTALQNWLISKGYSIPAGATGYFGAQTQSALAAFQAANGISPAAGYFGPITRAKVNAMGGSTGGSTGGSSDLSGGESSLEDLSASDGEEDEVEQGMSAEVAEFEVDVEDADIELQRLDLTFDSSAVDNDDDDEPWDVFEMVTIMSADGDEIASEDVSDEDDWLDDDGTNGEYVFRFTGLDYVVEEGETAKLVVEVEASDGSELGASNDSTWELYIDTDGLRGTDGEGIEQYIGDDSENVTFDIVEEGADDELDIRRSDSDPDDATLQVEDSGRSDWFTVFVFEMEADEDGGDIEIDTIPVDFTVSSGEVVNTVINDAKLVIDGEEFDDFDFTTAGDTFGSTTFDIDGDVTVAAGETVEVEVMVRFNSPTAGAYDEGDQITASVVGENIEVDSEGDITPSGNVTGGTHTLRSTGIDVDPKEDEYTADTTDVDGNDNDFAEFEVVVDITAFEDDVFISATSTAFTYQIEDANGAATTTSAQSVSATVSSTADTESTNGYFEINEGDTEEFTFKVAFTPGANNGSYDYRMQLLTIRFDDEVNGAFDLTFSATPATDYETDYAFIAN